RLKRIVRAVESLTAAAVMWRELGEVEPAAKAEWQLLEMKAPLPASAKDPLSREKFAVRSEVAKMYRQSLPERGQGRVARREDPGVNYWKQLIAQAKKKIALESTLL